jgi:hypothetical protein
VKGYHFNRHRQTPLVSPVNFLSGQVERIDHPVGRNCFSEAGFEDCLFEQNIARKLTKLLTYVPKYKTRH